MDTQNMNSKEIFTRHEYYDHLIKSGKTKSKHSYDYALRKDVSSGKVFHLGRDKYISCDSKPIYSYSYSQEACKIAELLTTEFYNLSFRIFEVTQLNSFVNHLYSHNTIFLSVENDIIDYVFDSIKTNYPGKVLLKPKADEYFRYLVDDLIVINRLPSESPKGTELFWHTRLEKILVDISVDKLLSKILSPSEYNTIFTDAFNRYSLDRSTMFRYANRKGAGKKYKDILNEYVPSVLEEI
ncbi:MAG: hypothetical protein J5864_09805 [Oscillospiraceae bacterium]|nr:hypothetical protein [Oscillospiraceae bacterium]